MLICSNDDWERKSNPFEISKHFQCVLCSSILYISQFRYNLYFPLSSVLALIAIVWIVMWFKIHSPGSLRWTLYYTTSNVKFSLVCPSSVWIPLGINWIRLGIAEKSEYKKTRSRWQQSMKYENHSQTQSRYTKMHKDFWSWMKSSIVLLCAK